MLGMVEMLVRTGVVIGNHYQVGNHILGLWQSAFLADWVLAKSVALFLMGRVGQWFPRGRGGGVGDSIGKGGGGLSSSCGCWRVSSWVLLSGAMRVLGMSDQWEIYVVRRTEGLGPVLLAAGKVEV